MRARIYQPARNAMSSGMAKTRAWILEFAPDQAREIDPLMGWTGSGDTQSQVRMLFESRKSARAYAKTHGIDAVVSAPHKRQANIRPGGYGENFSPNRRRAWTH